MESPCWSQDPVGKHSQYGETMIETGDIVAWDCPFRETTIHGIVTDIISLGGRIIVVNFGDGEDLIFDEVKLRRIA